MAAIDAIGGLLQAAGRKAATGIGIVKAIACLPSIISGAVGIFADVFSAAKNAAMGVIAGAVGAIAGMVESLVQNAVNQVLGAVMSVLDQINQLIGTIAAAIGMIKDFLENLIEEANNALAWSQNAENCRYAAAALLKCIMAQVITDISSDLDISTRIGEKLDTISNATDKITSKITGAGGIIEGFLNNAEDQANRATAIIEAASFI